MQSQSVKNSKQSVAQQQFAARPRYRHDAASRRLIAERDRNKSKPISDEAMRQILNPTPENAAKPISMETLYQILDKTGDFDLFTVLLSRGAVYQLVGEGVINESNVDRFARNVDELNRMYSRPWPSERKDGEGHRHTRAHSRINKSNQ